MTDKERITELEQTLFIICGAFPTVLIGRGDPHMPNEKVQKICAEVQAKYRLVPA